MDDEENKDVFWFSIFDLNGDEDEGGENGERCGINLINILMISSPGGAL